MDNRKVRTNQEKIEALERELTFAESEKKKAFDCLQGMDEGYQYWSDRRKDIEKQIRQAHSEQQMSALPCEALVSEIVNLNGGLLFAKKEIKLVAKQYTINRKRLGHWTTRLNDVTAELRLRKEVCNG